MRACAKILSDPGPSGRGHRNCNLQCLGRGPSRAFADEHLPGDQSHGRVPTPRPWGSAGGWGCLATSRPTSWPSVRHGKRAEKGGRGSLHTLRSLLQHPGRRTAPTRDRSSQV
eukprot:scaffold1399_cov410-Prasinococcus_capsulatus_cf.AAC.37